MNKKLKYFVVFCVIVLITLEFFVFPSLSAQIKCGRLIYPQLIESETKEFISSIKVNDNVFVGTWMDNSGTQYLFKSGGTGTISGYNIWTESTIILPFTYSYDKHTITINQISIESGNLLIYNIEYELNDNILTLTENNIEKYLIKV